MLFFFLLIFCIWQASQVEKGLFSSAGFRIRTCQKVTAETVSGILKNFQKVLCVSGAHLPGQCDNLHLAMGQWKKTTFWEFRAIVPIALKKSGFEE